MPTLFNTLGRNFTPGQVQFQNPVRLVMKPTNHFLLGMRTRPLPTNVSASATEKTLFSTAQVDWFFTNKDAMQSLHAYCNDTIRVINSGESLTDPFLHAFRSLTVHPRTTPRNSGLGARPKTKFRLTTDISTSRILVKLRVA